METLPLVILLIGMLLITMLTRVFLPIGQKPEGVVIKKVVLPFRYRLLYHRVSIYSAGLIMVLGGVGGWMSFAFQVVLALATFAILGIPIKYTLTSQAIALNNVVVRKWSEFQSVEIQGRFLVLQTGGEGRRFKVLAPPAELSELERIANKLLKVTGDAPVVSSTEQSRRASVSRPAKKVRRAG
jgi:uncharacterized membrane protein